MNQTLRLRDLLADTSEAIGSRHEARWLCEVASGFDGGEFDDGLDEPVGERVIAHLDAMLARLRAGEPLQYVLGRWGFRHLDLAIDRRVLIPRPETELVAGVAIELAAALPGERVVADLGTGSGAIGLSVASEVPLTGTSVWLTDDSADALDVARANLAGIGRAASNVRLAEGSWLDALPDGVVCDVVVSNPPYVAVGSPDLDESVSRWEPAVALLAGDDGLDAIRVIARDAPSRLRPGGWLVIEIGAEQGSAVRALLGANGYSDIEIRRDLAGHERIALGRAQ
ncbi:MAG: peptide chain release factor N(5)-glutamine methyltransferase [Ilumatobacter sp.]|nr:peptide chain release factor N(5)-glutamine methyltransferase [Ilumatobacter sp.]